MEEPRSYTAFEIFHFLTIYAVGCDLFYIFKKVLFKTGELESGRETEISLKVKNDFQVKYSSL